MRALPRSVVAGTHTTRKGSIPVQTVSFFMYTVPVNQYWCKRGQLTNINAKYVRNPCEGRARNECQNWRCTGAEPENWRRPFQLLEYQMDRGGGQI